MLLQMKKLFFQFYSRAVKKNLLECKIRLKKIIMNCQFYLVHLQLLEKY